MTDIRGLINAEKRDLFDVLAYIAFAFAPVTREGRVSSRKDRIFEHYTDKQQQFLSFVLGHYVTQGIGELDQRKLPGMLTLKYHSVADAVSELGSVAEIRDAFIGFQEHLYMPVADA